MENTPSKKQKSRMKARTITLIILGLGEIILTLLKIFSPKWFDLCEAAFALIGFAYIGQIVYRFCKDL